MPYVPPHLRDSERRADPGSGPPASGPSREYSPRNSGDYGSFGTRSFGSRGDGYDRSTTGYNGVGPRDRGAGPSRDQPRHSEPAKSSLPNAIQPKWEPSARVKSLTKEQIEEVRKRLNVNVEAPEGTPGAPPAIESFEDMGLSMNIMKDITYHSYTSPTPIQAQGMPMALSGRDMLGCAETGSGKTAAFAIPMIQHCLAQPPIRRGDGPLALVLAPTRELAQQIEKEVRAFSRSSPGFKTAIVVGGTHIGEQRSELRDGVEVVVATPGRFIDHLQQGNSNLGRVSYVVLDEADRMLDMGFEPQIREVMMNLPPKHQTLLFSATMPAEIEELAQRYLTEPVRVKVGAVSSPTQNVTQLLEKVPEDKKLGFLLTMLVEEYEASKRASQPPPLTIVFTERKIKCDELADALIAQGLPAAAIHGGRTQGEREAALRDFRKGDRSVLVATDVASRGLDVSGVAHVINYDLPRQFEDYVHRIGRTGRAGATGRATSLYTDRDSYIVAQIKRAIQEVEAGNTLAFATGKAARQKDREEQAKWRQNQHSAPNSAQVGSTLVKVEDKFKHMLLAASSDKKTNPDKGLADDAWDD